MEVPGRTWCAVNYPNRKCHHKQTTEPILTEPNIISPESFLFYIVSPYSFSSGKWTTYRSMAKETLDAAVSVCGLPAKGESGTDGLLLEGAHTWTPTMFIRLVQDYGVDSQVGCRNKATRGKFSLRPEALEKPQ